MRKIAIMLCAALTVGMLTGCDSNFLPRSQDISHVELVRTIAVDSGEQDRVKITVSSGVKRTVDGSTSKPLILEQEAETVFSACQMIQKNGSGYVSYGHVTECVVGKEAARAGIDRVLDYIQRDFEMRLDTLLFLLDQGEAGTLLNRTADKDSAATERFQEIAREMPLKSESWPCSVREFLVDLYDNGWSMMPVVKLAKERDGYGISTSGMALFYETELADQLDTQTSQGACLLLNQGKVGYEDLTLKEGGVVGLKLTDENCNWSVQWTGDTLTGMTAELQVTADLAEVSGTVDLQEAAVLREIEEKLSARITEEAVAALRKEKEHGDYLHLEREVAVRYPGKIKLICENWDQWLDALTFHINTRAAIRQSYDVGRGVEQS